MSNVTPTKLDNEHRNVLIECCSSGTTKLLRNSIPQNPLQANNYDNVAPTELDNEHKNMSY